MDLSKVEYLDLVREITRRENPKSLFLYDFWESINKNIFDGILKPCLVYQAVQPYGKSYGYIRTNVREIAIQRNLSKEDIFYTLIHEMCHQWQIEESKIDPDYKRIHYDQTWANILNVILSKFKSEHRAVEYVRKKITITHKGINGRDYKKRVNVYEPIIPDELKGFKILTKEEMLRFPFPEGEPYLINLNPLDYVSFN